MKAVKYKMEGDILIISAGLSAGVDEDKDGIKSVEVGGTLELRLDGSEMVDEMVKSSAFIEKFKKKLGL